MQMKHHLLRAAAAAAVTVFMAVGAMGPANAVTTSAEDGATTSTSTDGGKAHGKKQTEDTTTEDESTSSDHSDGTAGTSGDSTEPQPESTADENDGGANAGDCDEGTAGNYCSTRDGSESQNGKGDGEAKGKPCAGCVGKADNKNPKGQYPDGGDHNAGYECDTNQGVGQSNPAHTGCTGEEQETCPEGATMSEESEWVVPAEEVVCPEGATMTEEGECVVPAEQETCPEDATMNDEGECVVPAEKVVCPDDATMTDEGECVVPAIVTAPASDEVAGVELERSAPQGAAAAPTANRAPATVAPASGILPDTGAGRYGLAILAGVGLLAAGGVLMSRKRPHTGR